MTGTMRRAVMVTLMLGVGAMVVGSRPAAASEIYCQAGFYPHQVSENPALFSRRDLNGNGWVCVRGNGPGFKALVIADDILKP
jgi:hypothetical protein